jgi:pyruvate/2-oxoacid:ferredoxin oxidoreductase beta subunit
MTKDEALKLALEAMEYAGPSWIDARQPAITAIKEALAQVEPNYKKALEVWLDKTEWVQETVKPHELGMHRADVLKQRVEATLAQPEQDWIERERAVGYREGHRAALAQRTWVGLTDEEIVYAYTLEKKFAMQYVDAKLKEKNT